MRECSYLLLRDLTETKKGPSAVLEQVFDLARAQLRGFRQAMLAKGSKKPRGGDNVQLYASLV